MRISVITVCYNAADTLEQTMLSVLNQTYHDVEYIIIDGGSTDGSVDIIKKYAELYPQRLACWVSEPDKGIFDAMNKGVEKATGEWVSFMNSGDTYYDAQTIFWAADFFTEKADVVYGDTYALKKISCLLKASPIETIIYNMPFCHQASFVRLELMRQQGFDLSYKLCADYNFFYTVYQSGGTFVQIPLAITNFEAQMGVSSVQKKELKKEIQRITGRSMFSLEFEYFLRDMKFVVKGFSKWLK